MKYTDEFLEFAKDTIEENWFRKASKTMRDAGYIHLHLGAENKWAEIISKEPTLVRIAQWCKYEKEHGYKENDLVEVCRDSVWKNSWHPIDSML